MADTQKENAAPTSRAARASKRAARGVLRWGETLESLFLLSPDCPERKALAERVVQRPDDPAAWYAVLQNIPEAIKPDARCRLFRRATQSIPKNRPELYESEAYVSIWLGFAVEQAGSDALSLLEERKKAVVDASSAEYVSTNKRDVAENRKVFYQKPGTKKLITKNELTKRANGTTEVASARVGDAKPQSLWGWSSFGSSYNPWSFVDDLLTLFLGFQYV